LIGPIDANVIHIHSSSKNGLAIVERWKRIFPYIGPASWGATYY